MLGRTTCQQLWMSGQLKEDWVLITVYLQSHCRELSKENTFISKHREKEQIVFLGSVVLSDSAEPTSDSTKTFLSGKSTASLGCLGGLHITWICKVSVCFGFIWAAKAVVISSVFFYLLVMWHACILYFVEAIKVHQLGNTPHVMLIGLCKTATRQVCPICSRDKLFAPLLCKLLGMPQL